MKTNIAQRWKLQGLSALPVLQPARLGFGTLKLLLYMVRMKWSYQNAIAVKMSCQNDLVKMFYQLSHHSGFFLFTCKVYAVGLKLLQLQCTRLHSFPSSLHFDLWKFPRYLTQVYLFLATACIRHFKNVLDSFNLTQSIREIFKFHFYF